MARKDLSIIGKNIVASLNRPTSMDDLLENNLSMINDGKTDNRNYEKPKLQNSENITIQTNKKTKEDKPGRYETRLNKELDLRFRRYMFDHKAKTNPTLITALEEFLLNKGY